MVAHTDHDKLQAEVHMHRLWSGDGGIAELVARGKRKAEEVAHVLQVIKDDADFAQRFFPELLQPEGLLKEWQRFYKKEWQRFYEKVWGIKVDLSKLSIPAKQEGFNLLMVMLESMTARRIVNKMRELMKVWVYSDEDRLDKIESDREPNRDYAIWLRDRIEADEELKNLSANDLKAKGVNCITLPERLMFELFCYWKTNQHLDISHWTLCAGSRYTGGYVPSVCWSSKSCRIEVAWWATCRQCECDSDCLRCRAVISFDSAQDKS